MKYYLVLAPIPLLLNDEEFLNNNDIVYISRESKITQIKKLKTLEELKVSDNGKKSCFTFECTDNKIHNGYELYKIIAGLDSIPNVSIDDDILEYVRKNKSYTFEDMEKLWDFCTYNKGTFKYFFGNPLKIYQMYEVEIDIEYIGGHRAGGFEGEYIPLKSIPKVEDNKIIVRKINI
jgi:hypothetical protein